MVACPICEKEVKPKDINAHIDSGCQSHIDTASPPLTQTNGTSKNLPPSSSAQKPGVSNFFSTPAAKRAASQSTTKAEPIPSKLKGSNEESRREQKNGTCNSTKKRTADIGTTPDEEPAPKKLKMSNLQKVAPLAERMRPRTLDDIAGQELVGPTGILRNLITQDRVPSMILWGGAGTGKTTIARCIAGMVGSRFVEINSTSSGVGECKKLFADARGELGLTGRKTIVFCDEIHRFSKSQQDVFLGPVESGQITLIGATTENPSFKVQNALLSRCRTFTLSKLTDTDIQKILERALLLEGPPYEPYSKDLINPSLLNYLSTFSDGDARTALNLLELSLSLANNPQTTPSSLKASLTKTLVYDRAGDQHYDTISAFHKSVRGSDPDASLYYLARMLQSGEDPLFIARRLVVISSEDIGLADNSLLSLATATYTACEKIGMPECRIPLAHCTVALALAPKSTRAYRALNKAYEALKEPGVAALPVPLHLRNAPTRLMKEAGFGGGYKYNPDYLEGRARQVYLPEGVVGRRFLEDRDLGVKIDPEAWDGEELVP